MVTITEAASEKLRNIMAEKKIDGYALRVFVSGGGCSGLNYGMTFAETPETDDQVLDVSGLKVIIDPASFEYLVGAEIDFVNTATGSGFRIDNPNAISCGGCGSSSSCCN